MMNTFKKYTIAIFATVAILFTACEDADDGGNIIPGVNSILDQTENNEDLSMLNAALIRTGLNTTFNSSATYTLFAPNNTAFTNYLTANGIASIDDIPVADLRDLLQYHTLTTEVTTEVMTTDYIKTLGKDDEIEFLDLFIETGTSILLNGNVTIIDADSDADNGVVHIIDAVIELPTVFSLIAANPEFSELTAALQTNGLETDLSNTDGTLMDPYTIFAPNDAAFQELVDLNTTDEFDSIADITSQTDIEEDLLYHVKGVDRLRSGDLSTGLRVNTLRPGTSFTVDISAGTVITDGTMNTANVTTTDITAINGVVHIIDLFIRSN
ncbi:fasciclin domain-containing protein [Nonlabens sp.]|uniref:fasciclin domain-containing protein n=1 Tax=Nonlabens sp. TaxID=1888209 RepID=UPI0032656A24